MHNRRLLWHGSRTTNFAGILSQGLRIAPPEAPVVRAWPGECGVGSAGLCTWLRKELCRCSGESCPGEQGVLFKAASVVSAVADRWPDVPLQALGIALRQCLRPHSPSPNPTVVVVRLHLSGVVSGTEEVSRPCWECWLGCRRAQNGLWPRAKLSSHLPPALPSRVTAVGSGVFLGKMQQ